MSNVLVEKNKLDILANAISNKSGEPLTLTLDEMVEAVDGIETEFNLQEKQYSVSSAGQELIQADSGYDGLSSVIVNTPSGSATGPTSDYVSTNYSPFKRNNGFAISTTGVPTTPSISAGYISSSTSSSRKVTISTVIPYDPTPTVSGNTVTIPSGFYPSQRTATVPSGTAGTPTATKGTVSNHSVSVTPSVTNTTGYITGGTINGTAVSVSASELVSGTLNVTSAGTKDVTNYASASIPNGTEGTPTATKGTVSNHSVSVTPSVTNTSGFISGGTKTGTAVSVSASELVSGTKTVTTTGTSDVTNYASVNVDISFSTIYTGSSNPSSSTGVNGDIYLKVVS